MAVKKSWKQKIESAAEPRVRRLAKPRGGGQVGELMFIPSPALVRDYIAAIPAGETREVADMRKDLAAQNAADVTCPMVASIFARIVSEAAIEEVNAGLPPEEATPFWRIVAPGGPIAKKLSCDRDFIAAMRRKETAA